MAVVACALLGLLVGTAAVPAAADGESGKLLLLLDSSGSMAEKAGDGQTKISAAKQALGGVVEALPEDAQVGMRLYGATVFDRADEGACQDTQLVVPIDSSNRDDLQQEIDEYKPYGETPIAYSLEQAAEDLGSEGQRTILLVSDGEETCEPDPCPAAEKIAQTGIDLKVDVIGFNVSGKAKKQLRCVAEKGNGDYYDVDDTEDLEASLERLSTRAFRPFALSGKEVSGAGSPEDAPEIGPGDWIDEMPAEKGEVHYYRLRRSEAGSTFWVGSSLLSAVEDARLRTTLSPLDDPDFNCGSAFPGTVGGRIDRKLISGLVSSHSDVAGCPDTEEFVLQLGYTEDSGDLAGEKVQIRVHEEPPQESTDDLPPPAEDPAWTAMEAGEPGTIEPGNSFSNAPALEPGSYGLELMPGEIQTFKVEADFGQRIQAAATVDAIAEEDAWVTEGGRTYGVEILSPYGGSARAFTVSGDVPSAEGLLTRSGSEAGAITKEIRWTNRDSGAEDAGTVALPGEYFVVVYLNRVSEDDKAFSLPVNLTVQTFAEGEGNQPSAEPEPSGSPEPGGQDSDGGLSTGLVAGVAVGAAVILGGAVAGLLVWRRRRS